MCVLFAAVCDGVWKFDCQAAGGGAQGLETSMRSGAGVFQREQRCTAPEMFTGRSAQPKWQM